MSCKPISVEVQRGILRLSLFVFLSFLIIKKETNTFELKKVCFINRRETLCINKAVFFDHIVFQRGNQSARVVKSIFHNGLTKRHFLCFQYLPTITVSPLRYPRRHNFVH